MRLRVAIVVGVAAAWAGLGASAQAATDFWWNVPAGANGTTRVEQAVRITRVGPSRYWALGGAFAVQPAGDGWYMGLQTDGVNFTGQNVGDEAIFSVWNGTAAIPGPTAYCGTFGGEGSGRSCHVPIRTVAGHLYTYRLRRGRGSRWTASIRDDTRRRTTVIGTITAPRGETALSTSDLYNFIEDFRPPACSSEIAGAAQFADPELGADLVRASYGSAGLNGCQQNLPHEVAPGPGGVGAVEGQASAPPPRAPALGRLHLRARLQGRRAISVGLSDPAEVRVTLTRRGSRRPARRARQELPAGPSSLGLDTHGLRRGTYRVAISARAGRRAARRLLTLRLR